MLVTYFTCGKKKKKNPKPKNMQNTHKKTQKPPKNTTPAMNIKYLVYLLTRLTLKAF